MNEIVVFEKDWGNLVFSFGFGRTEVFPKLTLAAVTKSSVVCVGWLFFSLTFTIWDDKMREFNRRNARNAEKHGL